jgi:uncharacterized membrane protein YsdA (DUF1294 family)
LAIGIAALFLAITCGLAGRGVLPAGLLALYLAASVAAVIAYRVDKSAAQTGRWRIPESTLHLLTLMGGWPGALVAQRVFHHKSRKLSFQITFFATVVLNCAALFWFWWKMRSLR